MARFRLLLSVFVVLAVSVPSGASSSRDAACARNIPSGGSATCVLTFSLPHFDPDDAIEYETLVARIVSPQAFSWKVHAKIADGRGRVYFAWECAARRSVVTQGSTAYVDRTCQAWRRTVTRTRNGKTTTNYYTANTRKPQTLTVTASVGTCAPSGSNPCRFEAAAKYLLS